MKKMQSWLTYYNMNLLSKAACLETYDHGTILIKSVK